jgi:hypothetical protein
MLALLGQYSSDSGSSSGGGAAVVVFVLIYLAVAVLMIASLWTIFAKAGQKGWLAIIPILNIYVLVKLAGREGWWLILFLIPCINIVVAFIVYIDVAKNFGKSSGYGIGMVLLPFIFLPMLGFGSAEYQGDKTPVI